MRHHRGCRGRERAKMTGVYALRLAACAHATPPPPPPPPCAALASGDLRPLSQTITVAADGGIDALLMPSHGSKRSRVGSGHPRA
eukprot:4801988-Prymnesium_polylepis.1